MSRFSPSALLLVTGLLLGCGGEPPTSTDLPESPLQSAKGGKGKGGSQTVWTARVNDDIQVYKVRSDGKGVPPPDDTNLYADDEPCVAVQVNEAGGYLHLRTASNFCTPIPRDEFRFLTLDLSDLGEADRWDLDQDGMAEALEQVPVRFWAHEAFNDKVQTTPVEIWILEIIDNEGTTSQNAWEVHYQSEAPVQRLLDGSTVISLEPTQAAADLCEVVEVPVGKKRLKRECVSRAIADLPFHVTVAPKK